MSKLLHDAAHIAVIFRWVFRFKTLWFCEFLATDFSITGFFNIGSNRIALLNNDLEFLTICMFAQRNIFFARNTVLLLPPNSFCSPWLKII